MAVLAPCEGRVDEVILSLSDINGLVIAQVGYWEFKPGKAPQQVDLLSSNNSLDARTGYEVRALAEHPAWPSPERQQLEAVSFTGDELDQLADGEVIYTDPDTYDSTIGDMDDFEAAACPTE